MLVCDSPEFVAWRPDFSSSGQASPHWTKLLCNDVQLCNSMEWTDWLEEFSVQVELCEQCGHTHCATGGYVRLSRLGSHLLWTPPRLEHPDDGWEREQYTPSTALREHGAIAVAVVDWENWRTRFGDLPRADEFPRTERRDLAGAWAVSAPFMSADIPGSDFLAMVRERLIAAESATNEEALRRFETLVTWFTSDQDAVVDGELARTDADSVEMLHLDLPDGRKTRLGDWRPYAVHDGRLTLAFGSHWLLSPGLIDLA
jgi:hypothetical protein